MGKDLKLDRVDLADIAGPVEMAAAIHRQLGHLVGCVPVDDIARALDIARIRRARLQGCEGVLLTDHRRNYGQIAVNIGGGPRRARFSIAHELGHFLLESHELSGRKGFFCGREDLTTWGGKARHERQENEANRFAIELLAPAYLMKPYLAGDPDLRAVVQVRTMLDVSLEASTRRYIELHDELLAAVMTQARVVRYAVRARKFPWIKLRKGDNLCPLTAAHRTIVSDRSEIGESEESHAAAWLECPGVQLFEQTRLGDNGFAITLLWATPSFGEEDLDELRVPSSHWTSR